MGRPGLTLRYMVVAAVVLPVLFVLAARCFPGAGYLSVALAWALGYPIAFAVLLAMALGRVGLGARQYWASAWPSFAAAALATLAGAVVRGLALPLAPWARLAAVMTAMAVVFAALRRPGLHAVKGAHA